MTALQANRVIGAQAPAAFFCPCNAKVLYRSCTPPHKLGTLSAPSVCRITATTAQGCVLVYDVSNRSSFESLEAWLEESRKYGAENMVRSGAVVGYQQRTVSRFWESAKETARPPGWGCYEGELKQKHVV